MKLTKFDPRERKALQHAFLRFLPIPVVLILLASVLISYINFNQRKHATEDEQRLLIVDAMIDYRDHVSYLTSIFHTVESDLIDLAAGRETAETILTLFSDSITQYPFIDKLRLLDPGGMEVTRVDQVGGAPYTVPPNALESRADRDYYLEATLLDRHQYLYSGLDLARDHGAIEMNPETGKTKPVLRISSPLEISGQRIGYLVVNFLMRDYLDGLRTSLEHDGRNILILDENGYLYNTADDLDNFGFCYPPDSKRHSRTIDTILPKIDLSAETGSFIQDIKICSYEAFVNIYDRSTDYFLSRAASKTMIFMVCYDGQADYADNLRFSYFNNLIASWKAQLLTWAGLLLGYALILCLVFRYDRTRFTNRYSDNRYPKSLLKQALHHNQFVNYYQPIVNIQDGSVLGFEALSRWNHDDQVLEPSMFIDEILHYQLGQTLDENVFLAVRRDWERIRQCNGCEDAFVSINCCQQTFASLIKDPPSTLIRLTEEEKRYIVLELLEDIIFNQHTQERIQELYQHNVMFAIDDFGTGYSNVSFIRRFENLKVKIDRTFVPVDTNDTKERIIIEAFVKMFIDQGLKLIVEGVETYEQIQYLKKLGVAGVQGFYFSHPMTIDSLIEFMHTREYLEKLRKRDETS